MKTFIYSFERLQVWQLSRSLVKDIYRVTKYFPPEEKYELRLQLRSAAISVASNIAEGSSRFSGNDQGYMLQRAFGSITEVINQLIISNDLEYINEAELNNFRLQINELSNKLNAYHAAVTRNKDKSRPQKKPNNNGTNQ